MDSRSSFFELIRFSLGIDEGLSRMPGSDEWTVLYAMAEKQSVLGLCFVGVSALSRADEGYYGGMDRHLFYKWEAAAFMIQRQNEIVNGRCVELLRDVEKSGCRAYIMKGQGNSALYGKVNRGGVIWDLRTLRQPGDIDMFLEGGFRKVYEFVQGICPTREVNDHEIDCKCFPDVDVEAHYRPFVMRNPFRNRILQDYFSGLAERNFNNPVRLPGCECPIMVPVLEFNLVHQLVHIFLHFFCEGVGLRHLVDYYHLLLQERDSSVETRVRETVDKLELGRFASALMWVTGYVFAMDVSRMLWEPCESDGRLLLDEIIASGNFGKMDNRRSCRRDNKWNSFWAVHLKTFKFHRFDRSAWFWSPIIRIRWFLWRNLHGFK